MLKNRNLIILAAVLVVLGAVSLWQKSSHRKATTRSDTVQVLAADFVAEDLTRIEIGQGKTADALVLENLPDGWVIRTAYGHRANPQRVQTLLDNLGQLNGEYRSDVAAVLPDYGFDDSTEVLIRAFTAEGQQPAFSLLVGKKPERGVGNFVRLPGSNKVYLTRQNILSSLGLYSGPAAPQAKHFLDLEAYKTDRQAVDAITLHDGKSTVALQKDFPPPPEVEPAEGDSMAAPPPAPDRTLYEWKLTEPKRRAAMKTKADGVLNALCNIRAVAIDDPTGDPAAYGLADPRKRAEILHEDGSTVTVYFGAEREASGENPAGTYMRVGDEPTVWVVSSYVEKNIFKSYEDLLPED